MKRRMFEAVDDALVGEWRVTHGGDKASLRLASGGVALRYLSAGEREYLVWLNPNPPPPPTDGDARP